LILVTGASGFLGRHLLQALAKQPLPVRALYHQNKPETSAPGVHWLSCDLNDIFAVEEAMQGITRVYHCAAMVSFDARSKELLVQNNVAATANVVNAALEMSVDKLIHVSSIAALGRPARAGGNPAMLISEESHWEESALNSTYAESKFQSEMEVWRGMAEGLDAAIVNPSIMLGEGDWNKGSAHLMKIVYDEFPWYTGGINGWVDVKDVVRAMVLLMNSEIKNERFIINGGNHAYKDVFTQMAIALQRKPPHKKASPWMTEIVWRMEVLKSKWGNKPVTITKETARTAQAQCHYSSDKLCRQFPDFRYHSLAATIERMAASFLKDLH
jgi:dihydroflavonol-4-reductase